jgi:hypothetical protein
MWWNGVTNCAKEKRNAVAREVHEVACWCDDAWEKEVASYHHKKNYYMCKS